MFGSTTYKNILSKNYVNIKLDKNIFSSQTKLIYKILKLFKKKETDLIEIHNRPNYVNFLIDLKKNCIIFS